MANDDLANAVPPGRLVILSGPSGAGKSTVVERLLEVCRLPLELSVSLTTRSPRGGEVEGVSYRFVSPEAFESLRQEGAFLECKEVFGRGHWYGTLREPVASGLKKGKWVILEIDVEGAKAVMAADLDPISIFLHPGSTAELERRLRSRGTESEAAIQRRLEVAEAELKEIGRYQHEIINDTVDNAVERICKILLSYKESRECSTS